MIDVRALSNWVRYLSQQMHISAGKYIIHAVYLLHDGHSCGHSLGGTLQTLDKLKY